MKFALSEDEEMERMIVNVLDTVSPVRIHPVSHHDGMVSKTL